MPQQLSQRQPLLAPNRARKTLQCDLQFTGPFERAVGLSLLWLPRSVLDALTEQLHGEELEEQPPEQTSNDAKAAAPTKRPALANDVIREAALSSRTAAEVMIFQPQKVIEKLKAEEGVPERQRTQLLFRTLCEMRDKGPYRRLALVTPAKLRRIEALRNRFPNFGMFLDKVCTHLRLALVGRPATVNLPPMLLVGSPGIGKTVIIRHLAEILGLPSRFVACSELTAGFVLSGSSPQWGNCRHGVVAKILLEGEEANPLVILDELDKIRRDERWPTDGPLYRLLEPVTARTFRDEFLDIDVDASRILWLATANEVTAIPTPIISRLDVVHAADPTPEQMGAIADSVNEELLEERPAIRRAFSPGLPEDVKKSLGTRAPRTLKKALLSGYAHAIGRGRQGRRFVLLAGDIPAERASVRPIGFGP